MVFYDEKDLKSLKRVLDSGALNGGEGFTAEFEAKFAEEIGSTYAVSMNSAMSLLHAGIYASGAGVGDEVICDPIVQFSAIATMYNNAYPVFADVDPDTYLIDSNSVRERITERTKAIVCTHLWGYPAELEELRKIADEHNIVLIEDCAHALFVTHKDKYAGTWGHIGVFSFCSGKHLPTGDGGMGVTDDGNLAGRLQNVRIFGETPPELAWNFRMTALGAAVGMVQLERVQEYIAQYNANAKFYNEALEGCEWIKMRYKAPYNEISSYHYAAAFYGDKYGIEHDDFKQAVRDVGCAVNFGFTQKPAYQYELFRAPLAYGNKGCPTKCPWYEGDFKYEDGLCPNAEDLIPRLMTMGVRSESDSRRNAELLRKAIEKMG